MGGKYLQGNHCIRVRGFDELIVRILSAFIGSWEESGETPRKT